MHFTEKILVQNLRISKYPVDIGKRLDGSFISLHIKNAQEDYDQDRKKFETMEAKKKKMLYAPVAIIIRTKIEFHDAFKLLLQKIYESLQEPKQYSQTIS